MHEGHSTASLVTYDNNNMTHTHTHPYTKVHHTSVSKKDERFFMQVAITIANTIPVTMK